MRGAHCSVIALGPRGGGGGRAAANEGSLLVPLLFTVILLGATAALLGVAVVRVRRFRRQVGEAIAALGLAPSTWMMRGIRGDGTYRGRPIEVRANPGRRYSPAMLEVKIGARAARSFTVGPKGGATARLFSGLVGELTGKVEVPLGGPWLERSVRGQDPGFTSAFLTGPAGGFALRVTQPPVSEQIRYLIVAPGEVKLIVFGLIEATTNAQSLSAWTSELAAMADALDAGP